MQRPAPAPPATTDPATLAVIRGRLEQIVDEMDATLFRAAFSPVIAEARDGSHGIYDARTGETLVQGKAGLPIFVGAMSFAARHAMARAAADGGPFPGEVYLSNDPYEGATHLNDFKLVRPFFHDGAPFCILASVGHYQDIGGSVPGNYNPRARDAMQEGVRIPPVRLVAGGRTDADVVRIICANSRLPVSAYGDINAQLAALELGAGRLEALIADYGAATVSATMAEITARAERLMRAEIAALPDGTYSAEDWLDNDGITAAPVRIALDLVIEGETLTLDFSRSAAACAGPLNISRPTAIAATFVGLKHIFRELPANAGVMAPITHVIAEGSVLAAVPPRPVSGYTETVLRMIDVMFCAFAQVAPDRVNGASYGTINALLLSGRSTPTRDRRWILFTFFGGGHGGHPCGDGLNHGNAPISMASIPPVEIFEAAFPVLFTQWALRPDSGGPGRHRGGLGAVYEIEVLADAADLAVLGERCTFAPPGVLGGRPGAPNRILYDTEDGRRSPEMAAKLFGAVLKRGQKVRILSPGGGGFGPPGERRRETVARDVALGYISAAAAARDYAAAP